MQELFEKYTDDEILKYYSHLTIEGRTMRRLLHEIIERMDAIDEGTEKKDIDMLYETAKLVLPKEFTCEMDKCFCDGHEMNVKLTDMQMRTIVTLTSKLFGIYYRYNGTL